MSAAPAYDYVIGLGANLGSRRANLATAIERLSAYAQVTRISALYESEPWGPPQPRYLNAAVRVVSELQPEAMLAQAFAIESELGRTRDPALRYGPRTLDLDLLWSSEMREGPGLILPHPRLHERWFALAPLLDVAPELSPRYADALAAAGGRRPPRAPTIESPVALHARAATELDVRASAPEIEDAIADALTVMGRELAGAPPELPFQPRIEAIAATKPEGFIEQALARVARGFGVTRVILTRLDASGCEGRLLGRDCRPTATPLGLRVFRAARDDQGAAVEIAVSA